MKKVFFGLAFLGSVLMFNQGVMAQASLPGDGGSQFTCKVEILVCSWWHGTTRQICHQNGTGVECPCGQSTTCP